MFEFFSKKVVSMSTPGFWKKSNLFLEHSMSLRVKVDGPSKSGRSWAKLDGHLSQSGRSRTIVDGLFSQTGRSWVKVVIRPSGRSKVKWLYDLKYWIWTVSRDKSRRSKGLKLDGLKESMWTVPRPKNGRSKGMKLDGHTGTVPLVKLGFGSYSGQGEIRVRIQLGSG